MSDKSIGEGKESQRFLAYWEKFPYLPLEARLVMYVEAYGEGGCFERRCKMAEKLGVDSHVLVVTIKRLLQKGWLVQEDFVDAFDRPCKRMFAVTARTPDDLKPINTTKKAQSISPTPSTVPDDDIPF